MLKTMRMGDWYQIIVPTEWAGKTLDEIFCHVWDVPRKLTYIFRSENKVVVNGGRADWNLPLETGAKLQFKLFVEEEIHIIPSFMDVDILYEDDHVIVCNKPSFMNTHPNDPLLETNTLVNGLEFHLQSYGEFRNIYQIHRLDRDTSGAILFAKHALAGAILDRMLVKRDIKRIYIALVHGLLQKKSGTINVPIGRDRHHATRRRVSSSGQEALTHFAVLREDKDKHQSYLKCWLDTGRTHQIRVHLSHLGHPLVGDILYGGKPIINRQALHAAKL
ncbi:MAG: RluA family pseudouridine synthase [Bacillus sp. (in: Bacteria)]|nr:RluA family pseudouridine synthase [Bacillus sp. (in: firmicutes)]